MKIELLIAGWLFNALIVFVIILLIDKWIEGLKEAKRIKNYKIAQATPEQMAARDEHIRLRDIENKKRWPIKISVIDDPVELASEWVIVQTRWYPWPEDKPTEWDIYHRKIYWTKEIAENAIKSMGAYSYQRKQEFRIIRVNNIGLI